VSLPKSQKKMRIAIFGRTINKVFYKSLERLFDILHLNGVDVVVYEPFAAYLKDKLSISTGSYSCFSSHLEMNNIDFFFSVGGDGTFLEAVSFVRDSGIPMVGINSGRLGFLADIAQEELEGALEDLFGKRYQLQSRSLIKLEEERGVFSDFPYALNEFTVHKQDISQMITVHLSVGDEFLNSYWTDGLIVSTPTGSTAYSLSVGGPIMTPDSANFIIAPIAPHNLTVRPVVIPDDKELFIEIEGRAGRFMASLDFRSEVVEPGKTIKICKAEFQINVLKLLNHSFYGTLRNKLMWGIDKRN
jgi:NAD+ kinase